MIASEKLLSAATIGCARGHSKDRNNANMDAII